MSLLASTPPRVFPLHWEYISSYFDLPSPVWPSSHPAIDFIPSMHLRDLANPGFLCLWAPRLVLHVDPYTVVQSDQELFFPFPCLLHIVYLSIHISLEAFLVLSMKEQLTTFWLTSYVLC